MKKTFAKILCGLMVLTMLPFTAYANDNFAVTIHVHHMTPRGGDMTVETLNVAPGTYFFQVYEQYKAITGGTYVFNDNLYWLVITPGMVVELYEVSTVRASANEEIPYQIEHYHTDILPSGFNHTISEGRAGTAFVIDQALFHGVREMGSTRIWEEVTAIPYNKIIAVGTGPSGTSVPANLDEVFAHLRIEHTLPSDPVLTRLYYEFYFGENRLSHEDMLFMPCITDGIYGLSVFNDQGYLIPAHYLKIDYEMPFHVEGNVLRVNGTAFEFSRQFVSSTTAYTADFQNTGRRPGDRNFGITASGLPAQLGVVSVDRSVIPFHTLLFIEGYGFAVAGDTGRNVRGDTVDLFFDTSAEVNAHGRQNRNVFILSNQDLEIAIRR